MKNKICILLAFFSFIESEGTTIGTKSVPDEINSPRDNNKSTGFSVKSYPVDRPLWEIFADDLNADGKPEIIACDVDGIVTVRNPGNPYFLTYAAGALIYQFESADLNNDGIKEIIMSSLDPRIPVKAIDLKGNTVQVFGESFGPERIEAADMNKDGNSELAVSIDNLKGGFSSSGTAAGVRLYDNKGVKIWEKFERLREFHIADLIKGGELELVTGGPGVNFRTYNKEGEQMNHMEAKNSLLDHFILADIDKDGIIEIVASHESGNRSRDIELLCLKGGNILWNIKCPSQMKEDCWDYSAVQTVIGCGDFDKYTPGKETVMVGTNWLFLFDSKGSLLYQNHGGYKEYWGSWMPDGINPMDIGLWNSDDPELFFSSSRYRHQAYYKLTYGGRDEFRTFPVPDQEKHLDDIYCSLRKQPVQKADGDQKIKVFFEMNPLLEYAFLTASEETLRRYRIMLDSLESPHLEYLLNWDPNTPMPRKYRYNLTTDQIVERARLFERTGIPFGFWVSHAQRIWISDEVLQKSKEAAPTMFRFICAVENLENFYSPGSLEWMKWVKKTLDFCAENKMKMIFKDKQDIWALLPADTAFANVFFKPEYKDVVVPAFSTNQPYHFETQLGGLLGLKMAGLCNEFGISSQYWNWHEWGGYPRGIRDITPAMVCPSDIILRLDLMGIALGATWVNLEHGQPYFLEDMMKGLAPMAYRHREIVFDLIRKNILNPGTAPVNINKTFIVRSLHPEMISAKENKRNIMYPYYNRNTEGLRKGFLPARFMFEPYPKYAFPRIAYSSEWNSITCFPQTPYGWVPVLPPQVSLFPERFSIKTDGEKIMINSKLEEAEKAVPFVSKMLSDGTKDIPLEASGTCMIIHKERSEGKKYTIILIDPGYLAPTGVETILISRKGNIVKAMDMVSGTSIKFRGNSCPLHIQPGAFRVLKVELASSEKVY
jgi:hypothetical protein